MTITDAAATAIQAGWNPEAPDFSAPTESCPTWCRAHFRGTHHGARHTGGSRWVGDDFRTHIFQGELEDGTIDGPNIYVEQADGLSCASTRDLIIALEGLIAELS